MRFNMGCGRRKLDGFVNVDSQPGCEPDEVWDLERTPWPWPDDCAEEVRFIHSMEHLGESSRVFLEVMRELYRICGRDARVVIHVPHPRHDNFLSDPTHVRAITPDTLRLFDRSLNETVLAQDGANSPLGLYLGVDFVLEEETIRLDEPYWGRYQQGEISEADVRGLLRERNNVATEYRMRLRVRKA